jgi:hypothetical protein
MSTCANHVNSDRVLAVDPAGGARNTGSERTEAPGAKGEESLTRGVNSDLEYGQLTTYL